MSDARQSVVRDTALDVLRPLAELLLGARMGVGDFVAWAKLAYVQAAVEQARKAGERKRPNVSRIAVETGLTRGEVAAMLRQRQGKPPPFRRGRARAERVLSGWWHDPEFQGVDGKPVPLMMRGSLPSMVTLVERYSGTRRAAPVVEELLRAQAVCRLDDGRYQAVKKTCVNIPWDKQSLAELGLQLGQHFDALLHNLRNPDEPCFARFVQSGEIDPLHARVLLRDLKTDAEIFLESAGDRLAQQLYAAKGYTRSNKARQFTVAIQVLEHSAGAARTKVRRPRVERGIGKGSRSPSGVGAT
jgi:hypothetical protein